MYASADLLDVHRRTHSRLSKLLDHCAGFELEQLRRELDGFGYPNILLQLHHVINAEQYWIGVLHGLMLIEELEADFASIEAVRAFHERVTTVTRAYLRETSDAEIRRPREVVAWPERRITVVPAHVLLRTQTHIFQHQGQVAAMCRQLGRPIPPGLDFPLGEVP